MQKAFYWFNRREGGGTLLIKFLQHVWRRIIFSVYINVFFCRLWTKFSVYFECNFLSIMSIIFCLLWMSFSVYYESHFLSIMNVIFYLLWTSFSVYYERLLLSIYKCIFVRCSVDYYHLSISIFAFLFLPVDWYFSLKMHWTKDSPWIDFYPIFYRKSSVQIVEVIFLRQI